MKCLYFHPEMRGNCWITIIRNHSFHKSLHLSGMFSLTLTTGSLLGAGHSLEDEAEAGSHARHGLNCLNAADCVLAALNLSTMALTASPNKPEPEIGASRRKAFSFWKGCFQDQETSCCRSGKKGSFLLIGREPEPLRKCSLSLDYWDSQGSSGQSKPSFSVARAKTSTSSE